MSSRLIEFYKYKILEGRFFFSLNSVKKQVNFTENPKLPMKNRT